MTLLFDVARCQGSRPAKHPSQTHDERLLEQCKTCKRFTSPWGQRQTVMMTPYFTGECPERIAP